MKTLGHSNKKCSAFPYNAGNCVTSNDYVLGDLFSPVVYLLYCPLILPFSNLKFIMTEYD